MARERCSITFGETMRSLAADNRRRRAFMEKSTTALGLIAGFFSHTMAAMVIFRLSHYFFCNRMKPLAKIFYVMNIVLFGLDISPMSRIGPGFILPHLVGTVIHGKIGADATLFGQNVIGGKGGDSQASWYGGPVIGNRVTMYIGAKVLAPVAVGNDVVMGAMALVLSPVPDGKLVVGIPARVARDTAARMEP